MITLGRETGDIKEINAAVLLRELAALKEALAPEVAADVDISSMFSPLDFPKGQFVQKSSRLDTGLRRYDKVTSKYRRNKPGAGMI